MSRNNTNPQGLRRILLVDCDMFFVQVARLEDPDGLGKEPLLLIGGSSRRGVITSASYAARAFGVRSGMPSMQALELCPDAVVAPVPREACARRSREVRAALETLAPIVQGASIDEFYLDLTGTERMLKGEALQDTCVRIRESVLAETDISVSIGAATQRVVAKIAAGRAKPAGVHVVPPGTESEFMLEFSLSDLPGIGPAFLRQLEGKGLRTVREVVDVEREWLERWFGSGRGAWLWERVRGIDPSEVAAGERRKSISAERTFFTNLEDDDELERRLMKLCFGVGSQLRKKELRARTITVKLRDPDFTTRQASTTLPDGIEANRPLYQVAEGLLHELRSRRRTGVRLLGVGVSNLVRQVGGRQLGLFEDADVLESERDRTLSRVVDSIHHRFGHGALGPGRTLEPPPEDDGTAGSKKR